MKLSYFFYRIDILTVIWFRTVVAYYDLPYYDKPAQKSELISRVVLQLIRKLGFGVSFNPNFIRLLK